jgi:hypothetical protein
MMYNYIDPARALSRNKFLWGKYASLGGLWDVKNA